MTFWRTTTVKRVVIWVDASQPGVIEKLLHHKFKRDDSRKFYDDSLAMSADRRTKTCWVGEPKEWKPRVKREKPEPVDEEQQKKDLEEAELSTRLMINALNPQRIR